ncbi:MAG TPA: ABC transporter permease [Candidatus Blautia merdavium]|uniref:Nickel import system permease protein NikB n=1 Tax=Candidatus Blautia merdavium TaxID=2838494 RepID=A0A9D2TBP1_9FIRM|nr:ABC transporter permease [Candidatus Blautia merdavium]
MNTKKLGKRFLQILIILIGISFLSFLLIFISPGDPVTSMYASTGMMPSEEVINETREELGLNRIFIEQYSTWLWNCLHGDFGNSFSMHKPVAELLLSRLLPTIQLSLLSLVIMLAVSVPFGVLAAVYKEKPIDHLVRGISFFGVSMPNFWVGLLLLYVAALKLRLVPTVSTEGGFKQLILPALTLAFAMSAKYTRQVRTAVLEELNQDYVTGARARGLSERTILWRHVFPNALLPLVTMLGLSLGSLLGGTAVVEVIFGYQGLGNLAVTAITAMDYPLVQGFVLWIALIYMAVNLVVDISYEFLDPRIREKR